MHCSARSKQILWEELGGAGGDLISVADVSWQALSPTRTSQVEEKFAPAAGASARKFGSRFELHEDY